MSDPLTPEETRALIATWAGNTPSPWWHGWACLGAAAASVLTMLALVGMGVFLVVVWYA